MGRPATWTRRGRPPREESRAPLPRARSERRHNRSSRRTSAVRRSARKRRSLPSTSPLVVETRPGYHISARRGDQNGGRPPRRREALVTQRPMKPGLIVAVVPRLDSLPWPAVREYLEADDRV